jgi:Protein of unknown function (DUF3991)/Toprim-like
MDELLRMKQFDLRQYAASVGFLVDRRESSRGSTVMRRDDEKIVVSCKPDGVFTWWDVHSDDRGTIIDFVQREKQGLNLGGVRKELRAWLGSPAPALLELPRLQAVAKDLDGVRRRYQAMDLASYHPYLEDERCIPAAVLQRWRFAGRIKTDQHGAAIFPHFDAQNELCGYEIKNRGFSGFATGGRKGLWLSNTKPDDRHLVVSESAIDAISHAVLVNDPNARYGSIGGKPTALQLEIVRRVVIGMPAESAVVIAMDSDDAGRELADVLENVFRRCERADLVFRRDEPVGAKDWNDLLRARKPQSITVVNSAGPHVA